MGVPSTDVEAECPAKKTKLDPENQAQAPEPKGIDIVVALSGLYHGLPL